MSALKPAGWFNPRNDYHGYQQVAPEFEGKGDTIPLYQLPPGYVILSPDEVRALDRIAQGDLPGVWQEKYEAAQAIIRSLKGGRDAQCVIKHGIRTPLAG